MTIEMDTNRYYEAQDVLSAQFDEHRDQVERGFWNGDYAAEFAEYVDASDLAWLVILLLRTPWEDLQDVISAQGANEYRSIEQAAEDFITHETRVQLGDH